MAPERAQGASPRPPRPACPFIEETIAREGIDCDYIRCGRFVAAWSPRPLRRHGGQGAPMLAELTGLPTSMLPRERQREALGSDHYHGGMLAAATGSLHPGKYARGLAAAAERAGAHAGGRRPGAAASARRRRASASPPTRGELRADAVLVTTNGYSLDATRHRHALAGAAR